MSSLFHVPEIELIYHNKKKPEERPQVRCSYDAYELFMQTWDFNKIELQEEFKVMFLDQAKGCLGIASIASGGIAECSVDLRLVFAAAIKARSSAVMIAHNHPSGNLAISEPDKWLTYQFARAGEFLRVPLLDHLVLGKEGFSSFADMSLMPGTK